MEQVEFIRLKAIFTDDTENSATFALVDENGTEYSVDALMYCLLQNLNKVSLGMYNLERSNSGTVQVV